jgi:hypothetical protein
VPFGTQNASVNHKGPTGRDSYFIKGGVHARK